jgi:uncharacterized protein YbjT (DUF2867 family)
MDLSANKLATVFGGSGFLGTQVVQHLARQGYRVRVAVRRPDLALHLKIPGSVGQIVPIQANVRNQESVRRAVHGAHCVVNLTGIGWEKAAQSFHNIHTAGAAFVAQAAKDAGTTHLVHVSALGVDAAAKVSDYAKSKLEGEAAVLAAFPEAVILRPGLMFGKDDGFFNLLGMLTRFFPILPLIGGETRFQPVYVGDVAAAVGLAADRKVKTGRIYELGGPDIETHRQILARVQREAGRNRPVLPLPAGIARMMAIPMGLLPMRPLITTDQVELLGVDNVVSDAAIKDKRTLAAFGITPTTMDTVLPTYLYRYRKHGQFDREGDTSPIR